jgi:hypothetical protein
MCSLYLRASHDGRQAGAAGELELAAGRMVHAEQVRQVERTAGRAAGRQVHCGGQDGRPAEKAAERQLPGRHGGQRVQVAPQAGRQAQQQRPAWPSQAELVPHRPVAHGRVAGEQQQLRRTLPLLRHGLQPACMGAAAGMPSSWQAAVQCTYAGVEPPPARSTLRNPHPPALAGQGTAAQPATSCGAHMRRLACLRRQSWRRWGPRGPPPGSSPAAAAHAAPGWRCCGLPGPAPWHPWA